MTQIIFLAAIFGGMWLLLIRPQQRKMKAHQALIAAAKAGDRVHMSSGIFGTITEILDTTMYVEIAEGIEILVARTQVSDIVEEFPTDRSDDNDETGDGDLDDEDVDETIEEEA